MRKLISLLLVFALLFAVVACDNVEKKQEPAEEPIEEAADQETPEAEAKDPEAEAPADEPVAEGEQVLKSALTAEPSSLDVAKANDNYAINMIAATQEPLIAIYNDEDGNLQYTNDAAAESWEVSEDGLTYTFKLRDNTWSDGEPVTAQQYAYGIVRNLDPETGCPYSYLLYSIKGAKAFNEGEGSKEDLGVEAPDDKTLVVTLEEVTPHFLAIFGNTVTYAQRQDLIEANGAETWGSEANLMVYNGAHVVDSWVHNSEIVLKKNEHYWNKDKVKLTRINVPIINDVNTLMNMFLTGEIRSTSTSLAEWREQFESMENVSHKRVVNPQTYFMFFNCKDELFKNVKVRQAFSAALDREEFNEVIWNGNHEAATGWLPNQIFVDTLNYKDAAPNYIEDLRNEITDPKSHLAEGLKELGMDITPDELEVQIMLGSTDQWFRDFGEYLQQRLHTELGVTLNVEQYDWPIFQDHLAKSDYQIGYMAWGSETPEPYALLALHMSDSNSIGHGWANKDYDELILKAQHEQDPETRLDLYMQAEAILMNEVPVAPVVFSVSNSYFYDNIHGLDFCPFGNMGFRLISLSEE